MILAKLQSRASAAETLLKAMASEPRLLIPGELAGGERTVTELQRAVGIAMSAVSQHLAKLRGDGDVGFTPRHLCSRAGPRKLKRRKAS
jgi:DNA-binding HxlR family transcriptional regulator